MTSGKMACSPTTARPCSAQLVCVRARERWHPIHDRAASSSTDRNLQLGISGGRAEAKRFGTAVARLCQANSPDRYGNLAGPVLAQVDFPEKVFA